MVADHSNECQFKVELRRVEQLYRTSPTGASGFF